ncbi:MAG: biotin--[acetyl-CoA-carboxylase] ligase, partial [Acidimicrobiales bacterium]
MHLDERVLLGLAATTRFGDVRLLDEATSTNTVAAEAAAAGAPEGLVVVAEHQSAGRGRLGRRWEAAPGTSLLVSVLLRPEGLPRERWHLLTAAAGIAARTACGEGGGFFPRLKWPNDLIVEDRKLAGILAETSGDAVVVGMGLNCSAAPEVPGGAASVDEVAGRAVPREDLLVAWLRALDGLLGRWDEVAAAYAALCATVGRRVRVTLPGGSLEGLAEGLDPAGRLLLREADGTLRAIGAG